MKRLLLGGKGVVFEKRGFSLTLKLSVRKLSRLLRVGSIKRKWLVQKSIKKEREAEIPIKRVGRFLKNNFGTKKKTRSPSEEGRGSWGGGTALIITEIE